MLPYNVNRLSGIALSFASPTNKLSTILVVGFYFGAAIAPAARSEPPKPGGGTAAKT